MTIVHHQSFYKWSLSGGKADIYQWNKNYSRLPPLALRNMIHPYGIPTYSLCFAIPVTSCECERRAIKLHQNRKSSSRRDRSGWFCDSHCKVIVWYSYAFHVCSLTFSRATVLKVLKQNWNFPIFLSHFTVLNKHKKLTDHERENLIFDRKVGPKVDKHGRKLKMTYN